MSKLAAFLARVSFYLDPLSLHWAMDRDYIDFGVVIKWQRGTFAEYGHNGLTHTRLLKIAHDRLSFLSEYELPDSSCAKAARLVGEARDICEVDDAYRRSHKLGQYAT